MSLFVNKYFCLGTACLLNEPKTKAQTWLIYKQTNINEFFIEPSLSCHGRLGSFVALNPMAFG